ncbi:unnamed protein product [Closterium sp. Naga37s-1]|nr:unnamed protein product [Closterium sp. Naga37s-1]
MAKFSEETGESGESGRFGAGGHLNLDASASVFNASERPIREPVWAGAFIICAAIFVLREFSWFIRPLLSLNSFASRFFSLEALSALAIALVSIFPTMFVFLVCVRRMSVKLVKWCLRVTVAFFVIHSLMALHTPPPPPRSAVAPAAPDAPPQSAISGVPLSTSTSAPAHGGIGGQSAASILESAAPFSMSRFLRDTSADESHIHVITATATNHLAAYLNRRKLQEAAVPAPPENPNQPVPPPPGPDPNANYVLSLEMFLTDLLNGLAVLAVLLVCKDYHPLSSTVIGRASQAVMTRARGLIVGVAIFSFLCIVLFVPVIASLVELFFSCRFLLQQDPLFGSPDSPFHAQEERCVLWNDTIAVQYWLSPLAVIFLFIGIWMAYQIGVTLQFIAAATVAQVYSNRDSNQSDPTNTSSSSSREGSLQDEAGGWFDRDALVDRWNVVARAVKLAYSSSMGTICLVSFILTLATVVSVLLNVLVIWLFGMSAIVVVPRVAIAFALFIFTYFFIWFVVVVRGGGGGHIRPRLTPLARALRVASLLSLPPHSPSSLPPSSPLSPPPHPIPQVRGDGGGHIRPQLAPLARSLRLAPLLPPPPHSPFLSSPLFPPTPPLPRFVVVVAAISGHGSRRSLALSASLLRNHLKSALAVNLTAKCILGVISTVVTLILLLFLSILMLPLFGHLLKTDTIQALFVFLPVALAVGITAFSFKLVFVPVVATMFVCFAWDNRGAAAPLATSHTEELVATVVPRAHG